MPIHYHENTRTFHLFNASVSYIFTILENGTPGSLYYGARLTDKDDYSELLEMKRRANAPCTYEGNLLFSLEHLKQEYPLYGHGDLRYPACSMRRENGSHIFEFRYISHVIYSGKHGINGLPAIWCSTTDEMESLEVELEDANSGTRLTLYYTICSDLPVIARHTRITQAGASAVTIERVMSCNVDLIDDAWEMVQLNGAWSRERHVTTMPLRPGIQSVYSMRGHSSAQFNPFLALKRKECTETQGECMGFTLLYSGSFLAGVEVDNYHVSRVQIGIHPDCFEWTLQQGESFETPEAVYVYSEDGLNGMSQAFHTLFNRHLVRGKYRMKERPILINNWEATYFDFNTDKLLDIAREAKSCGIEMLVMDDGWFGVRNSDNCSLGDWKVNTDKITGGLKHLVDEVNKIGLEFGIWFEPEMISPNSDLYRAHPEWAIQIPGREATQSRQQYVLDLSRSEVLDYVYESVASILRSANIAYVKWDMNRQLSDLGSTYLGAEEQQELFHRYVLGVYALQERLVTEFPDLLLENCSGGGARFDPGMLYYSPQIWCSDDTDAIERLMIQEGTSLIYPLSTMGAHVSDCPNHTVGRVTPFETRGHVALAGTFGYELDVTKIPEEDRKMIPEQTKMYHKYHELVCEGDYYRIASYRENHLYDCWAVAAKDKSEVLVTYVHVLSIPNAHSRKIFLQGFEPEAVYALEGTEEKYTGEMLMKCGFLIKGFWGDFKSKLYHFVRVSE